MNDFFTLLWRTLVTAIIAGFVIAAPMTAVDWYLNPHGLFHSPQGTNWTIVAETFSSWFWPFVAVSALLVLPGFFWWSRRIHADDTSRR